MFLPRKVPAPPFAAWLRTGAGRRALGLGLALLIEAILILLMLRMAQVSLPGAEEERRDLVAFDVQEVSQDTPEARPPEPEPQTPRPEPQRPQPEQPLPPQPPAPTPHVQTTMIPTPWQLPPAAPRAAPPARPLYGPPDNRPAAMRDTEVVGRAPNGEPLYAASWYREPDDRMMRDYLSTSRGPGWGLIACRTSPNYRVEDCVALEEYPEGSQINRSVLAAAWEFRVRPPRRGGQLLVGSWVRIRITYDIRRTSVSY